MLHAVAGALLTDNEHQHHVVASGSAVRYQLQRSEYLGRHASLRIHAAPARDHRLGRGRLRPRPRVRDVRRHDVDVACHHDLGRVRRARIRPRDNVESRRVG